VVGTHNDIGAFRCLTVALEGALIVDRLSLKLLLDCIGPIRPQVVFDGPFATTAWGTQNNIIVLTPGLAMADHLPGPVPITIRRLAAALNYSKSDQLDLLFSAGCITGFAEGRKQFVMNTVNKAESVHPADSAAYSSILEKAAWMILPDGKLQEFAADLLSALTNVTKANDRKDAISRVHSSGRMTMCFT